MNLPKVLKLRVGHDADGSGWNEMGYVMDFGILHSSFSLLVLPVLGWLSDVLAHKRPLLPRKTMMWLWVGLQVLSLVALILFGTTFRAGYQSCVLLYAPLILLWMALGAWLLGRRKKEATGIEPPMARDESAAGIEPPAADGEKASSDAASTEIDASNDADVRG